MDKIQNCENCRFFKTRNGKTQSGLCKRFPPTLNPHTQEHKSITVENNDWCGEFNPKEK